MTNESKAGPSRAIVVIALIGAIVLMTALLLLGGSWISFVDSDQYRCIGFCSAISRGDIETVEEYLANGLNVACPCHLTSRSNTKDWTTPLHKAVGNPEMMQLLLRHGADVNARNSRGETALWDVVGMTDGTLELRCATLLIDAGIDIDARDNEDETAVHKASSSDSVARLRLLLRHGGNPNAKDRTGDTPMHIAGTLTKRLREQTVQVLLEFGADPNITNHSGRRSDEPLPHLLPRAESGNTTSK